MKIKNKIGYKNFTVTVPADLVLAIKERAAEADLTVSAYLRRLIKSDVIELKKT